MRFQSSCITGSSYGHLPDLLLNGVSIDMQWIPRDLNGPTDDISKFIDNDDYTITNDTVFNALDDLWDPNTCCDI